MVTVQRGKSVKITAEPLSQDESSTKLAEFFHKKLEEQQKVKKI